MANTTTLTAPGQQAGLNEWLDYIGKIHEKPMDLGLERMKDMIARMGIEFICPVFTVAGTNGKGSTCALLESVLRYAGYPYVAASVALQRALRYCRRRGGRRNAHRGV